MGDSVRALEALALDPTLKIDFLLVLAGEKPANIYSHATTYYHSGQEPHHLSRQIFDEVVAWAAASGLAYEVSDEHVDKYGQRANRLAHEPLGSVYYAKYLSPGEDLGGSEDQLVLFVAKDEHWLEKIKSANRQQNDELLGECYGFPATARAAFNTPDMVSPDTLGLPADVTAFIMFMFSKQHWRQELKTTQHWRETTRRLSPTLYQQILDRQTVR